jgi:CDP-6-deoxy-D-xylo-4-hexulose-3-dehydrase
MQAAIGCAQFKKLNKFVEARRANWNKLSKLLAPYQDRLVLPRATEHSEPSWFAFPITVKPEAGFSRNDLSGHLENCKIETRNLFSGNLLLHPAFQDISHRVVGDLKNSNLITTNTFFIGVYPGLTDAHLQHVACAFEQFMRSH